MNLQTIYALIDAATPFLRVEGIKPVIWCRNGKRLGAAP